MLKIHKCADGGVIYGTDARLEYAYPGSVLARDVHARNSLRSLLLAWDSRMLPDDHPAVVQSTQHFRKLMEE